MDRRWAPIATFFLGVVLTIGVYEGVRLVTNARQALTMASNQMKGEETPLPEAQAAPSGARRAARATREAPSGLQPRVAKKPGAPRGKSDLSPEEKRQILKARLAEMTPEEREALAERRAAKKKERQRKRLLALKAMRNQRLMQGGPQEPEFEVPIDDPLHEPIDPVPEPVDTGVAPE